MRGRLKLETVADHVTPPPQEHHDAAACPPQPADVARVLALQRSAGNAAVARAIRGLGPSAPGRVLRPAGRDLMRAAEHTAARRTLARSKLADYNDTDPQHDPSHVDDATIEATDEFKELSTKTYPPRKGAAPKAQALLACRLMLRYMREKGMMVVSAMNEAAKYLEMAEKQLGTLGETEKQVGHLNWEPFSTGAAVSDPTQLPTEFGRWVLAGGPMPDKLTGSINCWEMVLFGAFKAGYIGLPRIKQIYNLAVDNVKNKKATLVGDTVETELQGSSPQVFDPGNPASPAPLPGDLVVFKSAAGHMAIATGGVSQGKHGVISLWTLPGNISHTQKTTIEDLLAAGADTPVKFWTAKW
ncbi:MAG: hypothetical protein QOI48_672 [Solirubrobacteraceae bacterium]|jgi:hypothetical protein|nr:hypothetical protein [Solirubrobacteraceae bacterium]